MTPQPDVTIVDRDRGLVRVDPPTSRVCILGTTKSWVDAPLADPTYEIWGLNDLWDWWKAYATRWFEIHPLTVLRHEGRGQIAALQRSPVPVYMIRAYPSIPQSIRFPFERVAVGHRRLFTSTFAYQIALALAEGFKEIAVYGVDFSRGSLREQTVEWRGIAYWLGLAEGLGVTVTLPRNSPLLDQRPRYGLDYWREVDFVRALVRNTKGKTTDGARDSWRGR